jgi:hypothetical protein
MAKNTREVLIGDVALVETSGSRRRPDPRDEDEVEEQLDGVDA